ADTGFGNALNVRHTVRTLERAGADCIQLEDQVAPKRCGHFAGKDVISTEEAVAKIKAAVDARQDAQLMIMARTDACATQGFEAAVERAPRVAEAGGGHLFVEGGGEGGGGRLASCAWRRCRGGRRPARAPAAGQSRS